MASDPERDRRALELRKAGAPPDRIAEALDFTNADEASATVRRALADEHESLDEAHRLELERLDALQRALWPSAMQGKWLAVDRILGIMERRAHLLGLDGHKKREETRDAVDELADRRAGRRAGLPAPADISRP